MSATDEIVRWRKIGARRGFTMIELLVVLAVVVLLASLSTRVSSRSSLSAALQSAPTIAASQFALARTKAMSSGRAVRMLVNIDATSTIEPSRFLRYLVVQEQGPAGWTTISDAYLPGSIYVVPGNFSGLPAGLFGETESTWVQADGRTSLRSTVLRANRISSEAVQSATIEQWARVEFAPTGSTFQDGNLVLATGRPRAPGTFAAGESPIQLDGPERVSGLSLSQYGAMAFIHDRASF